MTDRKRPTCQRFIVGAILLTIAAFRPAVSPAQESSIVINEIMYHPDSDCELEEFIELHNRSTTETVNLGNWRFIEGVTYQFPTGTQLAPGGYLVVCESPTGFVDYYGTSSIQLFGPWAGKLANDGEDIELVDALGLRMDRVRYNDKRPWSISADGAGPSLELINPNDDNTSAGMWRAALANAFSNTWNRYEITGVPGSAEVYFYIDTPGECLIDDVELRATTSPATNYVLNGGFETASPLQWTPLGTHANSVRATTGAHSGSACLKLVATGAGGEASGKVYQTAQPLTLDGRTYTLTFWAKGLQPGVSLRAGLGRSLVPWGPTRSKDLGTTVTGGQSYNAATETYRVWGSGDDIWGVSDEFHYYYDNFTQDGSIEATVSWDTQPADGWAKAGIMIRESSSDAASKFACILLSGANGVSFQYRDTTGGGANMAGQISAAGPVRLRLTREDTTFVAEADTGGGFLEIGTVTFPMGYSLTRVGFAVTAHRDGQLAYANFSQPRTAAGSSLFRDVTVPNFSATPGGPNSAYSTNVPPYIRNVDTFPDQPGSANPIQVRARITDSDGITSVRLYYQIVPPGQYIRLGDPAYQTNWVTLPMTPATTPTYYTATIPAQPHRTLVRYRIAARDAAGKETRVPYLDDAEPNYARFVYNGVPAYTASPRPGVQPVRTHSNLTKVPVFHLIANPADVNEAQTVEISDRAERRAFKWYGTVVFNGKVYDHVRFRMRGGTWRYRYQKRMWKFRFNRGHYLEMVEQDGTPYPEELRTLNFLACIQTPQVGTWVSSKYGTNTQRGEAGIIERACYWLWQQVGAVAPHCTWIHYRIVDNASEAGANQYAGDFFGLYLAVQGMDERMLRMSNRPAGNLYKIDSFGASNPPWDQDAMDCTLPQDDIYEFRRRFGPAPGYPAPTRQWWEQNFDLDNYWSTRAVVDFVHHGDLYDTTSYDGVGTGKNYYFYHNGNTNKWEFVPWDTDLTFGTDHGAGSSPFRDRVVRNAAFPEFQIAYRNRLRECIQLCFTPEKFFPQLDEWRNLLIEIATADMDRWDYAPNTAPSDGQFQQQGIFQPLDTRLTDLKYWISERVKYLNGSGGSWALERGGGFPVVFCYDANIPATPTLTAPAGGLTLSQHQNITLRATNYYDADGSPHSASKWMATRVGGNELMPDWTSGITTTSLTTAALPGNTLEPGDYWLRVKYRDNTNRWSWWSKPVTITITGEASAVPNWREY